MLMRLQLTTPVEQWPAEVRVGCVGCVEERHLSDSVR